MQLLYFFYFLARLYDSTGTGTAIATHHDVAVNIAKMLKLLVKVFKSLYLLNLWMDLVDTFPDVRYWSEILC